MRREPVVFFAGCLTALAGYGTDPGRADTMNFAELFRKNVIKCVHPTVNPDKAKVAILKGPNTEDYVTTVRVKATYQGLVKTNTMEADFFVRQSQSIKQMKVKILADTSPEILGCALEKDWKDF